MFRASTLILVGTVLLSQAAWAQPYERYQQSILPETRYWYNTTETGGLYPIVQDAKLGLIDSTGRVIVPPTYDDGGYSHQGRAYVSRSGKFGFIDTLGRVVVPLKYDTVSDFWEGLAMVARQGRTGYVNLAGKEVIAPQFERGDAFSESLAAVRLQGKWGFIDHSGRVTIPPRFAEPAYFWQGIAAVRLSNNRYTVIDRTGTQLVEPDYFSAFQQTACVILMSSDSTGGHEHFFNAVSRRLTNCVVDRAMAFYEGFGQIMLRGKHGFVDSCGELAVQPVYDAVGSFSDSRVAVNIGATVDPTHPVKHKGGKWGIIDRTGKVIVEPRNDEVGHFGDGIASVRCNGRVSYVDTLGRTALTLDSTITWAGTFHGGRAGVGVGGHYDSTGRLVGYKHGYIDRSGRLAIAARFDDGGSFKEGLAQVELSGKFGYIDTTGKAVVEPTLKEACDFKGQLARVETDQGSAYIDHTGKIVWQGRGSQ